MNKEEIIAKLVALTQHIEAEPKYEWKYKTQINATRQKIRDFENRFSWVRQRFEMWKAPTKDVVHLIEEEIRRESQNIIYNQLLPSFLENYKEHLTLEEKQNEDLRYFHSKIFEPWQNTHGRLREELPTFIKEFFKYFEFGRECYYYIDDAKLSRLLIDLLTKL